MRLGWIAVLLALIAGPAPADEAAAWVALRSGAAIMLMRHADAPGAGDPAGFRLDDCATQRNLSEQGRADARQAGERLRTERIPVTRLLSSPWCRCIDTATLMKLAPAVQPAPEFALGFDPPPERVQAARRLLRAWRGPGVLLVVTHGATIRALVGGPNAMTSEAVVLALDDPQGGLREVGRLPLAGR
jgi:broad specificity phosphatase PhoE